MTDNLTTPPIELETHDTIELESVVGLTDPKLDNSRLEELSELGVYAEEVIRRGGRPQEDIAASLYQDGEWAYRKALADTRTYNHLEAVKSAVMEMDREELDVDLAAQHLANLVQAPQQLAALEEGAMDYMSSTALANPVVAQAMAETQNHEVWDMKEDLRTKQLITQMALVELEELAEDIGFVGHVGEFVVRMFPAVDAWLSNKAVGDTVEGVFGWTNVFEAKDKVAAMTPQEYHEFVRQVIDVGWNNSYKREFISAMTEETGAQAEAMALIEVTDYLPLIGPAFRLGRGSFNATEELLTRGARQEAKDKAIDLALKDDTLKTSEEALINVLDGNISPDAPSNLAGVSRDTNNTLDEINDLIDQANHVVTPERVDPTSLEELIAKNRTDLESRFSTEQTPVYLPELVDPQSRVRTLRALFDNGQGDQFPTKISAATYARENLHLSKGEYKYYGDDNTGYLIEVNKNVTETKNLASTTGKYSSEAQKPINIMKRWVWGAKQTQDETSRKAAQHSEVVGEQLVSLTTRIIDKGLKGLSKVQKDSLDAAMSFSHQMNKGKGGWMSVDQLKVFYKNHLGNAVTDKDILAYQTMRKLNDMDWYNRNLYVYTELAKRGYIKASIKKSDFWDTDDSFNATVRTKYHEDMGGGYGVDIETGTFKHFNEAELEELFKDGYVALKPVSPLNKEAFKNLAEESNNPVEYVMVRKANAKEELLDTTQLQYRAGGHRVYDAPWWIKQARRGMGNRYLNPHVHNAGDDYASMLEHVEKLEGVRDLYLKYKNNTISRYEADQGMVALIPDLNFSTVDDLVKKGSFDIHEKFVLVRDGEKVTGANEPQGVRPFKSEDQSDPLNSYIENLDQTGKMYYGYRGNHVPDINGKRAPILDPISAAAQSMNNSLRLKAFSNYQTKAIDRWVNTYGSLDDSGKRVLNDGQSKATTSYDRFMQADDFLNVNHPSYQTAKIQREQIMRLLQTKTVDAMKKENTLYNLGEWTAKSINPKLGKWIADPKSKDPITALRGLTFDARLGMFGADQMLLQTQTAWTALSMDPVHGVAAFKDLWFIRGALINRNPEVIKKLGKDAAEVTGTKAQHFDEMVQIMDETGFTKIGGSLSILDDFSPSQGLNRANNSIPQNIREKGRGFFYEGERLNKIVGMHISYSRWRKANPEKSIYDANGELDREILGELIDVGNTFSLNMTRSSAAWWQEGLASVPTQFASYQMRFLELMLPKILGGSDQISAANKFGMFAGQLMFYGSAGFAPTTYMQMLYENQVGGVMPDGVAKKFFNEGLWDTLLLPWIFGENTDFGTRAGLWGNESLLLSIWNPDNTFWEIAGGPSVDFGVDSVNILANVLRDVRLMYSTDLKGELTLDIISELAKGMTSTNRASTALRSMMLNRYITNNGDVLADNITEKDVKAIIAGIPLKPVTDHYRGLGLLYDESQMIKEATKELKFLQQQRLAAVDAGDTKKARRLAVQISATANYMLEHDPEARSKALRNSLPSLPAYMQKQLRMYEFEQRKQRAKEQEGK